MAFPKCVVKEDADCKFPSVQSLYDFFTPRTKSITVWSYGFRNGGVEIDIAESTGATVHIFDAREGQEKRYEIFNRIMNTHETEAEDPEWATSLTEYWILPDSTKFSSELPGLYSGSLVLHSGNTSFSKFSADRVDIVKVDYGEDTAFIVNSILSAGYRPGLFWVNWNVHPDESNATMAVAGNLQTLGYRLLKAEENYFVYIFVDECMYEICSWARTDCANPMFLEFKNQIFNSFLATSSSAAPQENQNKD